MFYFFVFTLIAIINDKNKFALLEIQFGLYHLRVGRLSLELIRDSVALVVPGEPKLLPNPVTNSSTKWRRHWDVVVAFVTKRSDVSWAHLPSSWPRP